MLASATTIVLGDLFFPSVRPISTKHILPRRGRVSHGADREMPPHLRPACRGRTAQRRPEDRLTGNNLQTRKENKQKNTAHQLPANRNGENDSAQQKLTMEASCQHIPPMPHNNSERKHVLFHHRFQRAGFTRAIAPRRNPLQSCPHRASGKRNPSAPCAMATGRACVCISAALRAGRRVLVLGAPPSMGWGMGCWVQNEVGVRRRLFFCSPVLSSLLWAVRTRLSPSFVKVRIFFSRL